ncbi:MAG TPA: alpha-L-arabinofuranosidase C-terminal domain-containing protein [Chryseolinea sp.]|nr:alpha-L-arabinofuranosidase C-terminal domain-containing protein [Chryseolinea sp.]
MKKMQPILFAFCLLLVTFKVGAQSTSLVINTDKPIAEVQSTMWGIFFEDINYGADGGLYAELVKNRSFEFFQPLMGWTQYKNNKYAVSNAGDALIISRGEESVNPRFARINVLEEKGYGLSNEGFFGMGIKKDMTYTFSIMVSQQVGKTVLRVELVDGNGRSLGEASVSPSGKDWKKYTITLKANATEKKAKLNLWFDGKGILDIDMVSLFPSDTWKQRPGGLRNDLIQLLADMKPGFLRFPGGCIVEGRELATRYQWKKTVGKVDDRELMVNRWNTEFKHRPAPDYFQSFGLGFYEYFQLSEDIGAEPLPILSCGMACQFNTAELVPMDELDPYIQDALDLIEFANGAVTSDWGKLRASMGHPAPFNLKFIGVGNEQWGPQYIERYKVFASAIKAKYPAIKIISGAGPFAEGELFDYASKELQELNADIVDEHYYKKPEWFLQNAKRYDNYDRKGPKIFAGEYAAQSKETVSPDNKNNWLCALSEAAFMTGLERNADVVHLSSYAPLFAHAEGWQWTPDLIWFDNLNSYGTPNYYVQKLFANYKGTNVLSILSGTEKVTGQNGLYASSVWDKNTKEIIIKLVNTSDKEQTIDLKFDGSKKLQTKGSVLVLKSNQLDDVNSFENPKQISPVESSITGKSKNYKVTLSANSFSVVRLKAQ